MRSHFLGTRVGDRGGIRTIRDRRADRTLSGRSRPLGGRGGDALEQSVDAFSDRLASGVELSLTGPSGGPVVLGSNEVFGDVLVPDATSCKGLFDGGQHHDEVRRETVEHWLPDVLGVGRKHEVIDGDVYPGLGERSH